MSRGLSLLALALLVTAPAVLAQNRACAADPYLSPETDLCNPLRYIPDKTLNAVAAALYFAVAIVLTAWNFKKRCNWFLALVIGTWTEAIGLVLRIILRGNPQSTGIYIAMYLFVVLSPCAFLAGDYILLGRLVGHLNGTRYIRPFKPNQISWFFIVSDVITFLIQAAGGGLSISKDRNIANIGGKLFLAGIAAQMASFIFFTAMWAVFAYRVRFKDQMLWNREGWKPLHWALGFTCICFLIRSVFRTIELSQGYIGYLATHERYFLGLDTLPLFLGILTYTYFWPGRYLTPETRILPDGETDEEKRAAELATLQDASAPRHEAESRALARDENQSRISAQESLESKSTTRAI